MSSMQGFFALAATAGSFFLLGAYYQYYDVRKRIQKLERKNPHAFFIRSKLYGLLNFFGVNYKKLENDFDDSIETHKLANIMKYGFPSMNEVRLKDNYVTAFDRRNMAIQWMCEHLECHGNEIDNVRHIVTQSEAGRVFFMSNIKPFLEKGFNNTVWIRLQFYIQEIASRYGSVFIYTGSIYLPKETERNNWCLEFQPENSSIVAVPTHFFKVIIVDPPIATVTPYAEAFVVPNAHLHDNLDIREFLSDIRDIENATGLKFFEGLERHFVKSQVASASNSNLTNTVNRQ